jgi:hypothetical protein
MELRKEKKKEEKKKRKTNENNNDHYLHTITTLLVALVVTFPVESTGLEKNAKFSLSPADTARGKRWPRIDLHFLFTFRIHIVHTLIDDSS